MRLIVLILAAYLTFVALAPAPPSHSGPPPSLRLGNSTAPKIPRRKPVVAAIVPQTLIEKKRYLFAGRRRAMRTTRPPEDFSSLRTVVAKMIPTHAKRQWAYESGSSSQTSSNAGSGRTSPRPNGERYHPTTAEKRQARELRSLELELLADAFEANDPHVHMDDGDIVRADVEVYGPDAPVASLVDLQGILEKRKRGRRPTWVGLRPGPPSTFSSASPKLGFYRSRKDKLTKTFTETGPRHQLVGACKSDASVAPSAGLTRAGDAVTIRCVPAP